MADQDVNSSAFMLRLEHLWCEEGSFRGPSKAIDTILNHAVIDAKVFAKRHKTSGLSKDREYPIRSSVSTLPNGICPANVLWTIMAVIVQSFDRPAFLSFAHVGQKSCEGHPSFTYLDSPPAIVRKRFIPGVEASRFHRIPNPVNPTVAFHGMPMFYLESCKPRPDFFVQAAARLGAPVAQIVIADRHFNAAVAPAKAFSSFLAGTRGDVRVRFADYDKSSKSATNDVHSGRHNSISDLLLCLVIGGPQTTNHDFRQVRFSVN